MAGPSEPPRPGAGKVRRWLENESERFLATVEMLWHADFNAQSVVPGLSTGFVVTHVARGADQFADELRAHRGADPDVDRDRRLAEATGALRPGAVIIDDVVTAFERLSTELDVNAADSVLIETPIAEILATSLLEVVVHHADLGSSFDELEDELADALFIRALHGLDGDHGWPKITVNIDNHTVSGVTLVGDVPAIVPGDSRCLLAWLTGRPSELHTQEHVELPTLPAWRCARPIDEFLTGR